MLGLKDLRCSCHGDTEENEAVLRLAGWSERQVAGYRSPKTSPPCVPVSSVSLWLAYVDYPCGLKYSTIPAPSAVTRNPTYSNGFGAILGGWEYIVYRTFTSGAKPNTIGIT